MWRSFPIVLMILAGCAGPAPETDDQTADPNVITDPRDIDYLANATPGSHIHDYWKGRQQVQVIGEAGSVWSTCSGGCGSGMRGAWARPQEDIIVPQGTKWINGTFNFTPHAENSVTTYELWVKTAQSSDVEFVSRITPGQPFSLESTQEKNDPPHYVLSLWNFVIVAKNIPERVTFRGDYEWNIEAIRGLPLNPYPPHPDRWNGKSELALLSEQRAALLYYETSSSYVCYGASLGCPGYHALPDGVVVPYDADRVEVRISGTVPVLGLRFHGADTRTFARISGPMDGADQKFVILLEPLVGDSPYAAQSLWEFIVDLQEPQPQMEVWTGTYTLVARAYK